MYVWQLGALSSVQYFSRLLFSPKLHRTGTKECHHSSAQDTNYVVFMSLVAADGCRFYRLHTYQDLMNMSHILLKSKCKLSQNEVEPLYIMS